MKSALVGLVLAVCALAQTSPFPTSLDSNATLGVPADGASSALTAQMLIGDTTAQVANAAGIPQWSIITFGSELAKVCLVSGNTLTFGTPLVCPSILGRGLSGSSVAAHSLGTIGYLNINAWYHKALASAVIAVEKAFSLVITPEQYGAVRNGSSDDSAAFTMAIATAESIGLPVTLQPGNYRVNAATAGVILNFTSGTGLVIAGPGSALTTISTTTAGADLLGAISSAGGNPVYTLSGFSLIGPDTITGPACTGTAGSGNGLRITGAATAILRLRDIYIAGFCGSGKAGLLIDNVENSSIRDVHVQYNRIGAIFSGITSAFSANEISNFEADSNVNGLQTFGGGSNTLSAVTIQSNTCTGWYMYAWTTNTASTVHFENDNATGTSGCYGLEMDSTPSGSVQGNVFTGVSLNGPHENVYMLGGGSLGVYGNVFTGGIASSGATPKVVESGAKVSNNLFQGFVYPGDITRTGLNSDVVCLPPTSNIFYSPGCYATGLNLVPSTYSTLPGGPAGAGATAGTKAFVSDSTTQTWGAAYSGGGGLPAEVLFDGNGWTVTGK